MLFFPPPNFNLINHHGLPDFFPLFHCFWSTLSTSASTKFDLVHLWESCFVWNQFKGPNLLHIRALPPYSQSTKLGFGADPFDLEAKKLKPIIPRRRGRLYPRPLKDLQCICENRPRWALFWSSYPPQGPECWSSCKLTDSNTLSANGLLRAKSVTLCRTSIYCHVFKCMAYCSHRKADQCSAGTNIYECCPRENLWALW